MSLHNFSGIFSLSMLFGLLLTIFYKRNFKFNVHLRCQIKNIICLSLIWGLAYLTDDTTFTDFVSIGTLYYTWKGRQDLSSNEIIKCLTLGASLLIVYFWESCESLSCLSIFFALTQLLRWPDGLKHRLREMRIIFGPVYTIFAVGSWFQSNHCSNLLGSAAFFSLLASVFLRPDNDEVLKALNYFGSIPTPQTRKIIHGFCMFASFISCLVYFVNFVAPSAVGKLMFCISCFIAVVNIAMYIFVAEFPRIAVKWLKSFWNNHALRVFRVYINKCKQIYVPHMQQN